MDTVEGCESQEDLTRREFIERFGVLACASVVTLTLLLPENASSISTIGV
ncbi:hypothetical protein [Fundidesulfovibrio butyratiphilus]